MRGPTWPFIEHENLHFDNIYNVHISSKNYEESNYNLGLDLLTISSSLCVYHILGEVGLVGRK